jgi:hypothetical protein
MFNIKSKPTFETTVKLPVAPAAVGEQAPSFRAKFRALSDDEFNSYDRGNVEGVKSFLRDVIVQLDDLVDDEGKPVTYTDQIRDELFSQQFMRAALMAGYFDAITGFKVGN